MNPRAFVAFSASDGVHAHTVTVQSSSGLEDAIVGGLIAGVVVLLGVVVSEILTRKRDVLVIIRRATIDVGIELPILLSVFKNDSARSFPLGSWESEMRFRVIRNLNEIALRTRRDRRNYRGAHNTVMEMMIRTQAAQNRWLKGIALTEEERLSLTELGLVAKVFGAEGVNTELLAKYESDGLPSENP